jgi:hypothetical protein
MKKYLMFTMLIAMMVCLLAVPGHIEAAPDVSVKVDGQYVSFPDQKPYIDSANRTMVPVRAPMEKMGCTVEWNDKTRQATITKGDKTAVFTIGKNTYTVNGQSKTMDTKAVITNNRTAFPIRFAAEAMGATVDWDANTYTVLINTKGVSVEKPEWNIIRRDVGRTFELKSLEPNRYFRFVCTSHPELNYKNTYDWNGNPIVERMDDGYCVSYELAPGGRYYDIPLKKGMVVTFDVYEKINGVEVKVDTIVETL